MDLSSERSHQVTSVKGFRNKVHLQAWEVIAGRSSSNWSSLSDINQESRFNQVTEISSRYLYFTGILQGFNLKKIKLLKSRHEETSRKLVTHEPDSTSSVNIEVVELIHILQRFSEDFQKNCCCSRIVLILY